MSRNKNLSFWLALLSIISAFGIHVYLTTLHFNLKVGIQPIDSVCDISGTFNCQTSLASSYSEFLGTPLSIWALGLHLILLGFLLAYRFPVIGLGGPQVARTLSRLSCLAIFAASIVMLAISALALKHYCPMCVTLYVLSLLTLIFVFLATKEKEPEALSTKELVRWAVYSLIFFLVFGFGLGRVFLQNQAGPQFNSLVKSATMEWSLSRAQSTSLPPAASIGPEEAPVVITEFADFLCGFCKNAAQRLEAFVGSRPDVRFDFYSFPLDGDCNPAVSRSHGLSCKLAYLAQCGFEQTEDFRVHQWIFRHQEQFRSMDALAGLTEKMTSELGLNGEELNICSEREDIKELITSQATAGKMWGVQGTPTIFVNSKKVPSGPLIPFLEAIYSEVKN